LKTWLKNNSAPVSLVLEKLSVSFPRRRQETQHSDLAVILQEWPILSDLPEAV